MLFKCRKNNFLFGGLWQVCLSPLIPLPSSWNVLRTAACSSRCSLPPLPEDATLLWGEMGAWSGAGPRGRRSSWESHPCPRGWLDPPLIGGVRDTERLRGLCCPPDRTARKETNMRRETGPQGSSWAQTSYISGNFCQIYKLRLVALLSLSRRKGEL